MHGVSFVYQISCDYKCQNVNCKTTYVHWNACLSTYLVTERVHKIRERRDHVQTFVARTEIPFAFSVLTKSRSINLTRCSWALTFYPHTLWAPDLGHLVAQPHSISRSINIRLKCRYCSLHAQTSTVAFNNGSHYADYHRGDNHDVKSIAATCSEAGGVLSPGRARPR